MAKSQPLPSLPSLFRDAPLYVAYSLLERTPEVAAALAVAAKQRAELAARMAMSENPPPPPQSEKDLTKAAVLANRNAIDAYAGPLDAYCIWCRQPSVFRSPRDRTVMQDLSYPSILYKHFICARNDGHRLYFALIQIGYDIEKIGQRPSLADLGSGSLDKYRSVLNGDLFAELHRAVGLCAHGVGIGSFVYLRRVFESQLEDAHRAAQQDLGWNEDEYQRQRVDERILSLRAHLPEFLVENRALYGILSKGIHELREEECLAHFPVVRAGIELILEDVLARSEREQKTKGARAAIARLAGELKQAEGQKSESKR